MKAAFFAGVVVLCGVAIWVLDLLPSAPSKIFVTDSAARPLAGRIVAGTLTIDNQGEPDWLVGAESPVARFTARLMPPRVAK